MSSRIDAVTLKRSSHLVLDGYNLIHRAKGGFQKGEWPIVFNFFRGLRPLIESFSPVIDVTLVLEGQPKRHEALLGSYKGNRASPDSDFLRQKDSIIDILKMLPINLLFHPDFEADDVVHNILRRYPKDEQSVVVSSDSDFTQLLQWDIRYPDAMLNNIRVWNWRTKEFLIRPSYDYVSWKALRGDATDNIGRCPGMSDSIAEAVLSDSARLQALCADDNFRRLYERNLSLIEFHDMSDDEWSGCNLLPAAEMVDAASIKLAFESFGFRSMLKDGTWQKWLSTFHDVGAVRC